VLFNKNKQQDLYPKRVRGANKRGVWIHEFNSTKDVVLDNGLIYTADEIRKVVEAYRAPYISSLTQKTTEEGAESEPAAEEAPK